MPSTTYVLLVYILFIVDVSDYFGEGICGTRKVEKH
jgi:hypothetical protein